MKCKDINFEECPLKKIFSWDPTAFNNTEWAELKTTSGFYRVYFDKNKNIIKYVKYVEEIKEDT